MIARRAAAGFAREGVLRGYARERGRRVDCVVLSLLPRSTVQRVSRRLAREAPGRGAAAVRGLRQRRAPGARPRLPGLAPASCVFERELVQQKLGAWAWFLGFWGIGTYKRNDEVDVRYEVDGRPTVAHALR